MKKKFKLLTSIASLGLALALMTFGVLAAASKTLNVTSNVTFEAKNVNATFSYAKIEPVAEWANKTLSDEGVFTTLDAETDALTITFENKLDETNKVAGYIIAITNNYTANQTINIAFTDVVTKSGNGWAVTTSCPATVAANSTVYAHVYVTIDANNIVDGQNIVLSSAFTLTLATAA